MRGDYDVGHESHKDGGQFVFVAYVAAKRLFTSSGCRAANRRNASTGNRPYASVPLKLQGHAPR